MAAGVQLQRLQGVIITHHAIHLLHLQEVIHQAVRLQEAAAAQVLAHRAAAVAAWAAQEAVEAAWAEAHAVAAEAAADADKTIIPALCYFS